MLYPEKLKDDEYIRMIALHRDKNGNVGTSKGDKIISYVKEFEAYKAFIYKYRYTHDVYNQIATNRNRQDGTVTSQRLRKVIYLDFDLKDYPDIKDAKACTQKIKDKIPKLFLHACISSGHGYHYYVSINPTCNIKDVTDINKELVSILGADIKAASPTQISRPPCTYNHKTDDGTYDYENKERWSFVKVIDNRYKVGNQFKAYKLPYLLKLIQYYHQEQDNRKILEKQSYHYEDLNEYPCYLCIRKVFHEGADKGQRNFWHGRIVNMLKAEHYLDAQIYSMCQEYNLRCRPPKTSKIVEDDTKRFLEEERYKLLGCYESFKIDDPKRKFVEDQCDKIYCGTYHNGAKVSIVEGQAALLNKKILTRKSFRETKGHEFLIITLLEVYKDSFGRRGFRVRNLQELLYSSIKKRYCIGEKRLKELLEGLKEKNYIEIIPDKKKPDSFKECRLKMARKFRELHQEYIKFYFSVANALIDGKISQTDYVVYIALVNNLDNGKKATYEELAETLGLDSLTPNEIGKHIRKLSKERCLVVVKQYSDKGYEWNKYKFVNPYEVENDIDDTKKSESIADNTNCDGEDRCIGNVMDNESNGANGRLRNYELELRLLA